MQLSEEDVVQLFKIKRNFHRIDVPKCISPNDSLTNDLDIAVILESIE